MFNKRGLWQKVLVLLMVLALIIPLLAACDDDDDGETVTVTATETATATATAQPTTTTTTQPPATTTQPPAACLSQDSTLDELTGDPGARAILLEYISEAQIDMIAQAGMGSITLREGSEMGGSITPAMANEIDAKLAALCGGETPTTTSSSDAETVKIGVLGAWTGPAAVASFMADNAVAAGEEYVEEQGGTLAGMPVEFIKYDTGSTVAQAISQFAKAALQDNVSIMFGGNTAAEIVACVEEAEKYGLPFIDYTGLPESLADYPYTMRGGGYNPHLQLEMWADFIINELKPDTVAFLVDNETTMRTVADNLSALLEDADIEVIDRQYPDPAISDYTPILTNIKQKNPDVLLLEMQNPAGQASLMQQITSLGGWGDIEVCDVSGVAGFDDFLPIPGMESTYHYLFYVPGLPYPGSQLMDRLYNEATGSDPTGIEAAYYTLLMSALAAVEGAGSADRDDIADYMRSGKLSYLGPLGTVTVGIDGENDFRGLIAKVVDGQWVIEPSTLPSTTSAGDVEAVKIGVFGAWTGPAALASYLADNGIKVAEQYIKEQGGTIGGMPVEFIKYDGGSTVAGTVTQFAKAALQDEVSIILGGMSAAEIYACTSEAEKYKVPYISATWLPESLDDYPYTTRGGGFNPQLHLELWADFVINELKPDTVAFITDNESSVRSEEEKFVALLEDADIEVIDRQYPDPAIMDYSPYLTRAKQKNPDVLLIESQNSGGVATILTQITSLGGWGDMTVCEVDGSAGFEAFLPIPGGEGIYTYLFYKPGLGNAGSQMMDRLYNEAIGHNPDGVEALYYMQLMCALAAIEGAESADREDIRDYLRSGDLTYLGPLGPIHVGTDGEINFAGLIAKVVNSQWVIEPSTLPQ